MKKRILILAAGYYYSKVIKQLTAAGFHVLAVDRDSDAYGAKFAHEFEAIDIINKEAVLAYAHNAQIDGIMAVNDFGTRTASYVSQKLNLVGLPNNVVEAANDKGLMRDIWCRNNLANPKYQICSTFDEVERAADKIGFPCVLKPTDCGGSGRGISVIATHQEIEWAYNFANPFVKNDRYILEEFIDGTEMTIESMSVGGEIVILAMSDKEKPDIKTRVATSLNYPAAFTDEILFEVEMLTKKAVSTIGIHNGMAHTEIIVTPDKPYLVEIGARGGGGHVFHTCIKASSGINAPVEFAKLLTGLPLNLTKIEKRGCVYRFFNPPRGILKSVKNIEKAKKLEGVLDIGVIKKIGDEVGNLENSLHRAGFVVTEGRNRNEAVALADYIEDLVEFEIEPIE